MASVELAERKVSGRLRRRDYVFGVIPLPYVLVFPALLVVLGLLVYPIIYSLVLSFSNRMLTGSVEFAWVGLKNYLKVLETGSDFLYSTGITLRFAFVDVFCEFTIGLLLALLLNRDFPGRTWLRVSILVPMMVPPLASGLMWKYMYDNEMGIISYLVRMLGSEPPVFLGDSKVALYAVIATEVWRASPFMVLSLLAALQAVPVELKEAAQVDGAGFFTVFRHVTVPFILPVVVVALLFRTVDALRTFDLIYLLTAGGPASTTEVISMYIYRWGFRHFKMGFTSASSVLLFGATLVICLFYLRSLMRRQRELEGV